MIQEAKQISPKEIGIFPDYKHHINFTENTEYFRRRIKPFSFSHSDTQLIEKEIDNLLENDVIESSVSNICSSAYLVNKKNGQKRMVVDYTLDNKFSKPDHFPLPCTNIIIENLNGKTYFSKLDLKSAYSHVLLNEETKN